MLIAGQQLGSDRGGKSTLNVPDSLMFCADTDRAATAVVQLKVGKNHDDETETTVRRQDRAFV